MMTFSLAKTIKNLLETPLLNKQGTITESSEKAITETKARLEEIKIGKNNI